MTPPLWRLSAQDTQAPATTIDWGALLDWNQLLPKLLQAAIVTILAIILHRAVKLVVRRFVQRSFDDDDPIERRLREQRAQTIGGLLENVAAVVIVTIAVLTILNAFVPIGPLLAGVGVLGLAVSFGAQSLVKDVITGTFLLAEGQFAVGDLVRIGDVSGTVERITLRTTILRDLYGVVHVVPNGEITRVSNLTKSWSGAVLDIGVAYKESVDHVIAVLKDELAAFYRDADWGPQLVQEPEVLGVQELGDSAVVIRLSARTLPQQQFGVQRELRRRIKNRFDREGIEIPFPHMTFYWGSGQQPKADPEAVRNTADHVS